MRKFFIFLALPFIMLFLSAALDSQSAFGAEKTYIKEKSEIRTLINDLNKYSNEHDIEGIKSYYSKDYKSYDGFNYDAFLLSIKDTFKSYPDISYKSKIKSININGNFASVELIDTSTSKRQTTTQAIINNKPVLDEKMYGTMESVCHYVVYLKKSNNKWQIYSDNIISEETAIKYGTTEDMKIGIWSPPVVEEGEEYCISLNATNKPKNSIMLASLTREEIKYPPSTPFDAFRKMPKDGALERLVIANKKGINEYSLASLGITEISLNEERTAINYKMSGVAFIMKRVNVYPKKRNAVNQEYVKNLLSKEDKTDNNAQKEVPKESL